MDLIFAEATPPGRGGVSVIRLSGEGARAMLERFAGRLPEARRAVLRVLMDDDEELDHALVMWFEAGHSFTGEEVAELQLHGAPVVVRRVCEALTVAGCRLAEAGEFTRRAFMNGQMDLAEIEGLGDLLEAETDAQRKLALKNARGALGRRAEQWRESLIRAGALVEVTVDFADEEVPDEIPDEVYVNLEKLRDELDSEIRGYPAAELVRKGFEVAVIGPPNAGKSSLINFIARREIALVSEVPGTTRDIIEFRADLRGLAVTFLDTAGMRDAADKVEAMGIDRAKKRAIEADLRLHLSENKDVDPELWVTGDILVHTKSDLGGKPHGLAVSSVTGEGVNALLDGVYIILSEKIAGAGLVSHERQVKAISDARDVLHDLEGIPPEILAEVIRQAASCLDRLLGRIGAEEYLDVIFGSFCIGK